MLLWLRRITISLRSGLILVVSIASPSLVMSLTASLAPE
jgi:hypothetical protein